MNRRIGMLRMLCALAAAGVLACASVKPVSTVSKKTSQAGAAPAADTARADTAAAAPIDTSDAAESRLSPATQLMIKACDNYLGVNTASEKAPDVLAIKASVYYNNRLFTQSRGVYEQIVEKYPKSPEIVNAVRMVAQSYYEEKQFDQAQSWFTKLRDLASTGTDKEEAAARIAESIFRLAQTSEEQQRYKDAAGQYERVALEFPDAKIADVSLYNSGLAYEKLAEWSHAILSYQKLFQRYETSKLVAKSRFRTAKCYEKLLQWENAAEMYLRVVAADPQAELAPTALYNAGFSFENAGKLPEAAATLEKTASLYPNSPDAADVLFKAGDLYGRLKDWQSVTRVNQEFTRRFGNDQDRVVQALCMVGIALYMQDKRAEAVAQLQKAIETFGRLKNPSTANRTYAANAQYTIAEIDHEAMKTIALSQPEAVYRKQLKEKSDILDRATKSYSKVLAYGVLEWTTRSVFQMGQANEDFALAILKQQRPADMPFERQFALELGIAQAQEEYLVNNALRYHEQNTKLGIKEKSDDKYVLASKQKLTNLPFLAGKTYLDLVQIYEKTHGGVQKAEGLALIGQKLETLQRIAPYQQRAMALFLRCLELGSTYGLTDDFYRQSSALITQTATGVGQTYADVATIAREAPIPAAFDKYERFVYKTKLLKQVEGYEDQALENFLKALKIAQAYSITDPSVQTARESLAKLLFLRGRCYDLLCVEVFQAPPYPNGVDDAEKEEYRAQFEEVALKLQEQAFEIYKSVLAYAQKGNAAGQYVTHAYVRLFQNAPDQYGVAVEKTEPRAVSSGPQWKCSEDSVAGWCTQNYADDQWSKAHRVLGGGTSRMQGFPDNKSPDPMWFGKGDPQDGASYAPARRAFFRRVFQITEKIKVAKLYVAAVGKAVVFLNDKELPVDTVSYPTWLKAHVWDVTSLVRQGKNALAVMVTNASSADHGVYPLLVADVVTKAFVPQPPGADKPLEAKDIAEGVYDFGYIKNFSLEQQQQSSK